MHKVIDTDGNLGTTGDQINGGSCRSTNWCYTPDSSSGGTVSPANDCTDNTGRRPTPSRYSPSGNYTVEHGRNRQPGYALVGAQLHRRQQQRARSTTWTASMASTSIRPTSSPAPSTTPSSARSSGRSATKPTWGIRCRVAHLSRSAARQGPFACDGNLTNPVTVVDNGANDADPDPGQISSTTSAPDPTQSQRPSRPPASRWTMTRPAPSPSPSGSLIQVIGTQAVDDDGNTDESDFHNRLGSISLGEARTRPALRRTRFRAARPSRSAARAAHSLAMAMSRTPSRW